MNQNTAQILATRCCICGKRLTDAESIELGLGPSCSKRYYDPLHEPTAEMVMSTLGLLMISKLPDHIILGFRKLVNHRNTDARKGSNLLIYWASCQYHDKEEVFKCSKMIRELGYTELADRLETDRTEVTITKDEKLQMYSVAVKGKKWQMDTSLLEIPGSIKTDLKIGRKYIWKIPFPQREHLNIVLGIFFGRSLACGVQEDWTTGVWKLRKYQWGDLHRYQHKKTKPVKKPYKSYNPTIEPDALTRNGNTLLVKMPYNETFLTELKTKVPSRARTWNQGDKRWEVGIIYKQVVKDLILSCYGVVVNELKL